MSALSEALVELLWRLQQEDTNAVEEGKEELLTILLDESKNDSLTRELDGIAKDLASWVLLEGEEDALDHAGFLLADQLSNAFDRAKGR